MKKLNAKKIISIFLAVLCLFSCFSVAASADRVIDEISSMFEDEPLIYYLTYKNETLSGVKMMYAPVPTVSLDGPGYVRVTADTPLAIDHKFICWADGNGNLYYEGDPFYVDGENVLYAVWEEKTDNDPAFVRVIKCALATLQRIFRKLLGIFSDIKDFDASYFDALESSRLAAEGIEP